MKKYLLTGVLALVVGGFLTSCHDDDMSYSSIAEAKQAQFAENFEKFFGKVDLNQDWGFGESSNTRTRSYADGQPYSEPRGGFWARPDDPEFNLDVPAPLTEAQKDKVRRYFQQNQRPGGTVAEPMSQYFVQHVYTGATNLDGSLTTEKYWTSNVQQVNGSSHMDRYVVGSMHLHLYNFNATTATSIPVWDGVSYEDGYTPTGNMTEDFNHKKTHNDQIMLVRNVDTQSFGWYQSDGSLEINDHYRLVSGDVIQAWDQSESATINGESQNANVSGMMFVGFDYEGNLPQTERVYEPNSGKYIWGGDANMAAFREATASDPAESKAYFQGHTGDSDKQYVLGCADGYFSDWIVRITKAVNKGTSTHGGNTGHDSNNVYKKKLIKIHKWVLCEDLGNSYNKADFDYNDLVFDVKIIDESLVVFDENNQEHPYSDDTSHKYYALVTPLAAGGELAIKFQTHSGNIHSMFVPQYSDNILINTVKDATKIAAPSDVAESAETFKIDLNTSTLPTVSVINDEIVILVTAKYNEGDRAVWELKSYRGKAPHKLCVDPGTQWPYERVCIADAYTGFADYVENGVEPWNTGVNYNLYPLTEVANDLKYDQTNNLYNGDYELDTENSSTTYNVNLSNNEIELWKDLTGAHVYDDNYQGDYAYIEKDAFANAGVGSIVRFYGIATTGSAYVSVSDGGWSITNDDINNDGWLYRATRYNEGANYKELVLNETSLAKFQANGMYAYGKDLILLCVSLDNTLVNSTQAEEHTFNTTGTQLANFTSNPQTSVSVDASRVSDVGENTTFHVYGVGEGSVTASTNGTAISASAARTRAGEKSFNFTVNATQAASIRQNGITFAGSNFQIYKVTIEKVTYTPPTNNTGTTYNLLTSSLQMTGGVIPVITDKNEAINYANKIVAGSSELEVKIKVTANKTNNESWYFKIGLSGVSGDNGPFSISSNDQSYNNVVKDQEITLNTIITTSMLQSINSNVNNKDWWSGGLFGVQGSNVTIERISIIKGSN